MISISTRSTSRHSLVLLSAITAALAAPLAFAQDAGAAVQDSSAAQATPQSASTGASGTVSASTPATAATPPADASGSVGATAATSATPATPDTAAPGSAKPVSWSALDADKDGKLSKTEVSSVKSLSKAFDKADANKDGALTTDEYKAYLAAHGSAHAHQG